MKVYFSSFCERNGHKMKFVHLSDLHIGKTICNYSFIEDQRFILNQILDNIKDIKPDGVIIAGDVYNKSIPSAEAVTVFDEFITKISNEKIPLYIISGNHDNAERLSYGADIFKSNEIYFSPVYDGKLEKITKEDEFGKVNIFLCPFVRRENVRQFFPDDDTSTVDGALKTVMAHTEIDESERNLLVCHQFVTGAIKSESEDLNVGTLDNVDAKTFDGFDYVALGHIHGQQKVYRDTIRYCGTPLKYSISEENHKKSMTVVELLEKGNVKIDIIPLNPLRNMRTVRGNFNKLIMPTSYENENTDDYVNIILTDEMDIPNGLERMRSIYPHIMIFNYDNKRTQNTQTIKADNRAGERTPAQLFSQHYEAMNNKPMSEEESEFVNKLIEEIWGENV